VLFEYLAFAILFYFIDGETTFNNREDNKNLNINKFHQNKILKTTNHVIDFQVNMIYF